MPGKGFFEPFISGPTFKDLAVVPQDAPVAESFRPQEDLSPDESVIGIDPGLLGVSFPEIAVICSGVRKSCVAALRLSSTIHSVLVDMAT